LNPGEIWFNLARSENPVSLIQATACWIPACAGMTDSQFSEQSGEVSEWLKEHAWKVCIRQRIEGSNPSLSANKQKGPIRGLFVYQGKGGFGEDPWFDLSTAGAKERRSAATTAPKGRGHQAESSLSLRHTNTKGPCAPFYLDNRSWIRTREINQAGSTSGVAAQNVVRRATAPKGRGRQAESSLSLRQTVSSLSCVSAGQWQ
jgi:hypothetical protein